MNPPRRIAAVERARRARDFMEQGLWRADLAVLPSPKAAGYSLLRMLYLTGKGFLEDRLPLRAAALTFTTLLSIVPLLAVAFSVAKGLGVQEQARSSVLAKVPAAWPQELKDVVTGIFDRIDQTDFGALGAIGLLVFIYTAIKLLVTIEKTFNDIWGVREGRTWVRRFSDYLSALVVMPILMLAATSANAFLASERVVDLLQGWAGPLLPLYLTLLRLSPYLFLWTAFTAIYIFMPNVRVRFLSGLTGGILAGTCWQVLQWLYIHFQVGIAKHNVIYGTFAALPVFLVWLQASWLIVLFGAELAFAHQNHRTYRRESEAPDASFAAKEQLGLEVAVSVVRAFLAGGGADWDPESFASQRKAPIRLVREVLATLQEGKILVEVSGPPARFVPARDPGGISAFEVLAVLKSSGNPLRTGATPELAALIGRREEAERQLLAAQDLKGLAQASGPERRRS